MGVTVLESTCVVASEGCEANLKSSLARGLSRVTPLRDPLAIVGSGPSLSEHLDELRSWPGTLWAVNGAYDYLLDQGIVPQGFVGVDPLPGLAEYVRKAHDHSTFYMSGLCDPAVFDALKTKNVVLWFPEQTGIKFPAGLWMTGGGTTALTRAPFLAHMLGFRDLTMFGADSSFKDDDRYCYKHGTYGEDSKAPINKVMINGEGPFLTEIGLLKQVSQFGVLIQIFDGRLKFKCGGLLDAFLRAPMTNDIQNAHAA